MRLSIKRKLVVVLLLTFTWVTLTIAATKNQEKSKETVFSATKAHAHVDYIAFGLSICTFLVTVSTLYYTKKTKDLQEKTERNTRRVSLKHERTILHHISWNLLKSYNNLVTIGAMINHDVIPAKVNFKRMMVDISELHINDSFEHEVSSKGIQLLYETYAFIIEFNRQLERRYDQSEYLVIKYNHNSGGFRLSDFNASIREESVLKEKQRGKDFHIYFTEEKESIRKILYSIDKLYPYLFNSTKKGHEDTFEYKANLVSNSLSIVGKVYQDGIVPYSEDYLCRSGITLDSCKYVLNMEDADKYYSLPFVYYYNRVHKKLKELDMQSYNYSEEGLLDNNLTDDVLVHRLPVHDNYIDEVLSLIESEVGEIYSLENRDIFIEKDNNKDLL